MNTYLTLFLIATCSSLVITPLLRRACERFHLVDLPRDGIKLHRQAVPRLGGLAIFLSVAIALLIMPLVDNLLTRAVRAEQHKLLIALIPAALVLLLGIYDDLRGANAKFKFIILGLIGALFCALGGRIEGLSIPFIGGVNLPPVIGFTLTVFWVVGIANAFNLIDGIDGLATGAALFASLVLLVESLVLQRPFVSVVAIVLFGALTGFLRYNFNPASIFLGDSGALFVGFTLAALSVEGGQKASTTVAVAIPILAFALPVVDTGVTITRRFISGKPIFEGDREHIHHMLLRRGWSERRVVLVLYGVSALFGLLAMLSSGSTNNVTGLMLLVLGVAAAIAVGHLSYHELDEIKASVKRNFGDRRARATNNIRIRRACRAMSHAESLGELFDRVLDMLEFGEFDYATIELDYGGRTDLNKRALALTNGSRSLHRAELRDGVIFWQWEWNDCQASQVVGSSRFWMVRLPLATERVRLGHVSLYRAFDSHSLRLDVNYLSRLFQREMSQAAERVFEACKNGRDGAQTNRARAAQEPSG